MSAYGRPEQHYSVRDPKLNAKFKTWEVEEIDSRKRRKKGTLGVGNMSIVWSCEASRVPIFLYPFVLELILADTCTNMANNLSDPIQYRKETPLHRIIVPTDSCLLPLPRGIPRHRHRNLRRNRRTSGRNSSHRSP